VAHVADFSEHSPSLGVRLLEDLRTIFSQSENVALTTERLLTELRGVEEGPWADLRGKPLDPRGLSRLLKQYGVKSRNVRDGDSTPKGYRREDLHDAWQRYLPLSPDKSATSATSATEDGGGSPNGHAVWAPAPVPGEQSGRKCPQCGRAQATLGPVCEPCAMANRSRSKSAPEAVSDLFGGAA
jgi:hypothetical protein